MQSLMTIQLAFAANIPRRVVVRRGAEFSKLKRVREDRLYQILMSRKVEREHMRKMIYFVKRQEERQRKSREEEEARQREEAERRRKEEAELKAKQDEIYEKQKQREKELEEKKRQQIEEVSGRSPAATALARPTENPVVSRAAEAGLASAPTTGNMCPDSRGQVEKVLPHYLSRVQQKLIDEAAERMTGRLNTPTGGDEIFASLLHLEAVGPRGLLGRPLGLVVSAK